MISPDPDNLKIPAFQRKKSLKKRADRPLLWTALDRQKAGLLKEHKRAEKVKLERTRSVRSSHVSSVTSSTQLQRSSVQRMDSSMLSDTLPSPLLSTSSVAGQAVVPQPLVQEFARYKEIGEVTAYLPKIDVAVIFLSGTVRVGDCLIFEQENGLFEQFVDSMQLNRKNIKRARKGQEIGMKVKDAPMIDGRVFLRKR